MARRDLVGQVARALGEKPIPDKELVIGKATAEDRDKLQLLAELVGTADRAPLWAYILSEAQVTSGGNGASPDSIPIKLGPVGGRIVADVFAALLRGDPTSYLNRGAKDGVEFTPIACFAPNGEFGLAELIKVALRPTP